MFKSLGQFKLNFQKRHGAGNEQQNVFKSLGLFVSNFEQPSSATEPEAGNKTCSSHRDNPSRSDNKNAPRCRKRAAKRVQVAGKIQAEVLKHHGTGTEQQGMFKSLGQFMRNSQNRHGAGNWQQNLFKSLGQFMPNFELPSSATEPEAGNNASSNHWDNASRSDKQKHTTEPEASSKACSSRWESSGQMYRNATGSNRAAKRIQVTGKVRAKCQKRHGAGN